VISCRFTAALVLAALPACVGSDHEVREPAYRHRDRATGYRAGADQEKLPPEELTEVRIGWFGPDDPAHPDAGGMWSAARMAIEERNEEGGYNGLPFRLLPVWSENPWGSGIKAVTRLVYEEGVWALAGSPDGPSAHLVEQITAKARLPFVNPVSTDKSANLAGVPWIFSCAPGDHLLAPLLAGVLVDAADGGAIGLVTCTDHDSRLLTHELLAALAARDRGPDIHLEFGAGTAAFDLLLETVTDASPSALAVIAGPLDSGRALRAIREIGITAPVIGGPAFGRRAFVEVAGAAAEGVMFPLLWDRESIGAPAEVFAEGFEERTGLEPDYAEAFAYDSVRLLLAAIEDAGLNRARIGDAIQALSSWSGAGGPISWDRTGQNTRPVPLGIWRAGRRVRGGE
jgi:branched-chain amino acid transport system substrate-binding protein